MHDESLVEIEYKPGTTIGPFDEAKFQRFRHWLQQDFPSFEFDPDYIAHLRKTNGGVPIHGRFMTARGRERLIERVNNFFDLPSDDMRKHSCVSVSHTYALDSDAFDHLLIPFADLFAGDIVCLDHRHLGRGKPPVVIWLHEESETDSPATEFVADSFRDFVQLLF